MSLRLMWRARSLRSKESLLRPWVKIARCSYFLSSKCRKWAEGAVCASDAFFPFRDGFDVVARAGVTAVIQPGGSLRDGEVIDAADEQGIAMVFTGLRHFRH